MRKNVLILFLLLTLTPLLAGAQDVFQKMYGAANGDQGYAVINSSDGNFVIAGSYETDGPGTALYLLTKITPTGDTLWVKTYGLRSDTSEVRNSRHSTLGMKSYGLVECSDNGYLLTGAAFEIGSEKDDVYMVKTDAEGELLWTKAYGGNGEDYGNSLDQTNDNGFIVGGATESFGVSIRDGYVLRLDEFGDTLWTLTIGGASLDEIKSIIETEEGDFVATGSTFSSGAGNSDVFLVKINSEGSVLWEKTFGGVGNDFGNEIIESPTGYVIAGATMSFGYGEEDAYLMSVDFDGNLLWSKAYGAESFDGFNSIVSGVDGTYMMVGYTQSFGSLMDVLLVKTDDEGNIIWHRAYGGNGFEFGEGLVKTEDTGCLLVGYSNSFGTGSDDIYLIKILESDQHNCKMNVPLLGEQSVETIVNTSTSVIQKKATLVLPETIVGATYIRIVTECYSSLSIDNTNNTADNSLLVYPNPSAGFIFLEAVDAKMETVKIYNSLGQFLRSWTVSATNLEMNLNEFERGIYSVVIETSKGQLRKQIVLQ